MKIKMMLVFSLFIILAIGACQATPEDEIVVNKGDGTLESIIAGSTASQQSILSDAHTEKWRETCELKYLTCEIDADVIIPAVDEFPVYKVRQIDFDTETLKKLIYHFTKDATGVRDTSDTKEELEEQLLLAKRGKYMVDDNGGRWEPYEGQEEDIAELEKKIANVQPESFSPITENMIAIPIDKTYALPNDNRIYVYAKSQSINIFPYKYGVLQPESWLVGGEAYPGEPKGTTIDNIKITEEAAKKKAGEFLKEIGIRDYGIAETEKARIIESYTYDILSEGWRITFARNDGNSIPVYINSSKIGGLLYYKSEDYIYRWPYEQLEIYVDETGIRCFHWEYPKEVVETMNGNVQIKPLDEIKERIRNCLKYAEAAFSQAYLEQYGEVVAQQIRLSKMVLTNVLVPIKDEPEYHMLVPAWVVYYEEEDSLGTHTWVLAINAIDGSFIDITFRPRKD
jgi:hypothetical protein